MDDIFNRAKRFGVKIKDARVERACELEGLLRDVLSRYAEAENGWEDTRAHDALANQIRDEITSVWKEDR